MLDLATFRISHEPEQTNPPELARPWIWPLPRLDGQAPCVLAAGPETARDGVALGYPGRSFASGFVPVFAAHDGVLAYASRAGDRPLVCLEHPGGWSTQYAELAHVLMMPTDRFHQRRKLRVVAGDVLGHAPPGALRIRFTLSQRVEGECSFVHPSDAMHGWTLLPWFSETPAVSPRSSAALLYEARGAR